MKLISICFSTSSVKVWKVYNLHKIPEINLNDYSVFLCPSSFENTFNNMGYMAHFEFNPFLFAFIFNKKKLDIRRFSFDVILFK